MTDIYTIKLAWMPHRSDAVEFALEELILDPRATGVTLPLGGDKDIASIDWQTRQGSNLILTLTFRQINALECALGQAIGRLELCILHARSGAAVRPYSQLVAFQHGVWMVLTEIRDQRDIADGRKKTEE